MTPEQAYVESMDSWIKQKKICIENAKAEIDYSEICIRHHHSLIALNKRQIDADEVALGAAQRRLETYKVENNL